MSIQHFCHDQHPLILKEEPDEKRKFQRCNGCSAHIFSGPYYSCTSTNCDFHLHKRCSEIPQQTQYPGHPQCVLTLQIGSVRNWCASCHEICKDFVYHCSKCFFSLHLLCGGLTETKFEHKSHKHPLSYVRREALFFCNGCRTQHGGRSYLCGQCCFWIHENCASLPRIINHSDHDHPLSLTYNLSDVFDSITYSRYSLHCHVCSVGNDGSDYLPRDSWAYYCVGCRYFLHVKCAIAKPEAFMSMLLPDRRSKSQMSDLHLLDPNLIHLPPATEFTSIFSKMSMEQPNGEAEIIYHHFSHHHPLILHETLQKEEYGSSSSNSSSATCNGCIKPISVSAPFYGCTKCEFFLHKSCSQLPMEVNHQFHEEHTLVLIASAPEFLGIFNCNSCRRPCNGFAYHCATCKFYLDVNCALLPTFVVHEAHKHHQLQLSQKSSRNTNCCPSYSSGFGYNCNTCDFRIHVKCALYPSRVFHRYDEHPLVLTYAPVENHPDEYYCEPCESELHSKQWYYHCVECNQSFHRSCIQSVDDCMNLKFGGFAIYCHHDHPLTLSRIAENTQCGWCSEIITSTTDMMVFQCSVCGFKIHLNCAEPYSEQSKRIAPPW